MQFEKLRPNGKGRSTSGIYLAVAILAISLLGKNLARNYAFILAKHYNSNTNRVVS